MMGTSKRSSAGCSRGWNIVDDYSSHRLAPPKRTSSRGSTEVSGIDSVSSRIEVSYEAATGTGSGLEMLVYK